MPLDCESGRVVLGHWVSVSRRTVKGHKRHHQNALLVEAHPEYAVVKPACHGGRTERVPWSEVSYLVGANRPTSTPQVRRGGFAPKE